MNITYDFHIHSALSPCADDDMTPANIMGMAYLNQLDAVAITDHQSCRNLQAAYQCSAALRKEYGKAPILLPGMEVECSEGFHFLAYFPSIEKGLAFEETLTKTRLLIPNRVDIFGRQLLFDENDSLVGEEPLLLLTASSLSFDVLEASIRQLGGLAVPAHIDRESYSILASLGAIPPEYDGKILELSKDCKQEVFLKTHPELKPFTFISSSDAHHLDKIADPGQSINLPLASKENLSAQILLEALQEKSYK